MAGTVSQRLANNPPGERTPLAHFSHLPYYKYYCILTTADRRLAIASLTQVGSHSNQTVEQAHLNLL